MPDRAASLIPRYDDRVRAWFVMLVACGGSPEHATSPVAPPAPKRDLAVAEPAAKEPTPPEEDGLDPNDRSSRDAWIIRGVRRAPPRRIPVLRRRINEAPEEVDIAASEMWSPCVKDFVQRQSETARRAWTAAFARYTPGCDVNQRASVEPPREYRGKPYVAFTGRLDALAIELVTCGSDASIHDAWFELDGRRKQLLVGDPAQREGCTVVVTPDSPSTRRVLREAIESSRPVVHFDNGGEEPITDDNRRDLRLMLDALSAP